MSVDVDALIALTIEKQIPLEKMISAIENTVTDAYRELEDAKPQGRAVLNRETGEILIHVPLYDEEGIYTETEVHSPEGFDQVISRLTRKEIKGRMRAAKDADIVEEFSASVGDVISGVVQQGRDSTIIYVDLGRWEGKIPANEQIPTESYKHGQRIKAFVVGVVQGEKGPEITLSRTHPLLVKALFTLEVPELKDRVVEIVGVTREPGQRSKVSVRSHRQGVSPKGALIGPMGARAKAVTDELNGEKIDIVDYSEDPAVYVANALAPARVTTAELVDEETKSVKVIVPDFQLSLAIGKDGQNARLAARLTGCRIDIHPDNPVARIEKPKPIIEESVIEEPIQTGPVTRDFRSN
jgi:N utilization substance protein A